MKAHALNTLFSVSLGIVIGWLLIGRDSHSDNGRAADVLGRNQGESAARIVESGAARHLRSLLASDEIDNEAFSKAEAELDPSEIGEVVEWLSMQGGLQGLDFKKKSYLRNLIFRWHQLDPEAALAWIASREHPGDRQFYYRQITAVMGLDDLPAAIDFLEKHVDPNAPTEDFPYDLFSLAAKEDPDLLVRLCGLSVNSGSSMFSLPIDFPEGFDFRRCVEGFASLAAGLSDGQRISNMPVNLVTEWSKIDPQAAFEWAITTDAAVWERRASGPDPLTQFFSGFASASDTRTYGSFVADFYRSRSDAETTASQTLDALSAKPDSATIDAFLAEVSPEGNSDVVISQILPTAFHQYGQAPESLRSELFARMTPAGRLAFIKDLTSQPGTTRAYIDLVRSLPQLGHTEEEIRQATAK
ncbi:hypothetical protein [Haloferula sargassicola]|uniref:Uncharacterized protein n=1 Tax=Haloferula sargassicola TaxID=490096 RepID=A0ABP9USX9_9BACT